MGVSTDSPERRNVQAHGEIEKPTVANGLHHYYFRKVAQEIPRNSLHEGCAQSPSPLQHRGMPFSITFGKGRGSDSMSREQVVKHSLLHGVRDGHCAHFSEDFSPSVFKTPELLPDARRFN